MVCGVHDCWMLQVDNAGVDILLVGDSVAMVVHGHDTTLPVTLDEMILHCKAVSRGSQRYLLFLSCMLCISWLWLFLYLQSLLAGCLYLTILLIFFVIPEGRTNYETPIPNLLLPILPITTIGNVCYCAFEGTRVTEGFKHRAWGWLALSGSVNLLETMGLSVEDSFSPGFAGWGLLGRHAWTQCRERTN